MALDSREALSASRAMVVDVRPVIHVLSLLVLALAALMVLAWGVDRATGHDSVFGICAFVTAFLGGLCAGATRNSLSGRLGVREAYLLTVSAWVVLPAVGAVPFVFGAPAADITDAYFEAVSGITTTGTTVFVGLDDLPPGVNLWRGILQWLGGLGIIIAALLFLPIMKIGGMQFFRTEAFDTMGKVMPRAVDISASMFRIYIGLTIIVAITYAALGMSGFDAVMHALTTISTGGFSSSDASFAKFPGSAEYAATLFMVLAGLPFIRYVQLIGLDFRPLLTDPQVRAYLRWTVYAIGAVLVHLFIVNSGIEERTFREVAFNLVSISTGTGYGSADVTLWGTFPLVVLLIMGFIGSCTASTGCAVKVFRYLVLIEALKLQLRAFFAPHGVFRPRYGGRPLPEEVLASVIAFFTLFLFSFALLAVALTLTGLSFQTSVTAAWTAICNIGPAFGPEVGATGAVDGFPTAAKWLMIVGMIVGRLEVLSVVVVLSLRFWRD